MQEFLQQLVNGIAIGSIYALIALGYTMVYGILRFVNFAHGDVFMVGAFFGLFAAGWIGASAGANGPAAVVVVFLAAMFGAAVLGVILERFAYKPVRGQPRLNALITAIGVSLFLENAGILIFGADPKTFPELLPPANYSVGGVKISSTQVMTLAGSCLLMLGLNFVVYRTRIGKAMRAVSFSRDAASLMGIPTDRVITATFALGSALAAAAGVLFSMSYPRLDPLMGVMQGLKAFVAAVLGGIGNIPGAVVGGLVLGLAETLVSGYLSSTYRDAIAFVLLIVILIVKPSGLLGRAVSEKV
ncbi:MAG: branched-chain amino acid ABC transporter permease [Candidatus Eisenbacteria bacterium]|nr:branched-chain amino acid ABC transporter permease [Candidatus Eisenbacteria bacterium]MCC7143285.1 branched-chain amino acid ABC transporter permease [Candidatus Eisenbacteria bacterium]